MAGENPQLAWLDRLPLAGGVVRDGCFVYVSDALLTLLGYSRDELIGQSLLFPVAPEDRDRMRERHAGRVRGEPVTDTYEFDAIRVDGTRRRMEIWVTVSGEDSLFQLYDRTEAATRHRKLQGLAQLGAAVQSEPDREAILACVDAGVEQLGMLSLRVVPEGDGLRMTHRAAPAALRSHVETEMGESPLGRLGPWSPGSRAAWRDGIWYIDDFPADAARHWGQIGAAVREVALTERVFHGVFLRIDEAGAPSHMLLLCADWLMPEDVAAMSLFGAQVTAALTAARIIADLSVRNAELTALNRIASAAGTYVELATLLARGCEAIEQVLRCTAIAIYLSRPDEGVMVLAHQHGGSDEARRLYGRVPIEGTRLGEVMRTGLPRVLTPDDYADPQRRRVIADMRQDVVASVPL
ncbi:MAG: PAS domain S-box protein, partial [Deltaproteobacteria bacterium]